MKNFKKSFALVAGVAALALVGTGYAAWTFTTNVDADLTATSQVAAAIEAKNVEIEYDNLYLIVDACNEDGHNHEKGNGIYWSTSAENDIANKVATMKLTGKVNENDEHLADISSYVGKFTVTADAITTTYVTIASGALEQTVDVNSKDGDCEYDYTLPEVSFVSCPGSVDNVTAIKNELDAKTLKFTVSFNVVSSAK